MALFGKDEKEKLPKGVEERLARGRERLQQVAPFRDEAWEFYRGNHFAYVDEKLRLQNLPTVTNARGGGKPSHRARQARNLIFDLVLHEISAATQRVPSYQVVPSTSDIEDASAARLSEKVALYGYTKWQLRQATVDAVEHAIVGGEAFAWPYFDNTVGPFISESDVGTGDVRVRIFGSNECYWEPGLRFEQSPWHAVEQAQALEEVEEVSGHKLTADAEARALSNRGSERGSNNRLVIVTHYLQKPSAKNPAGLWVTLANNKRIHKDRPYPADDCVLRKLSYARDADADRDLGLVPQTLDPQRTKNDAENKAIEWKNLCLNPRIVVTPGLMRKQRWTDEPGKVYEIPQPEQNFQVVNTPQVPNELFEMADRAVADIGRIAAQNDIPSQVESGKAVQTLTERDDARRQAFIADLAEWHSQIMHDCLTLVQEHYTEPRLIQIKGSFGWESERDFRGADLRSQLDVRVMPESIEPHTKQAVEQRVMNYAQLGWIGPDQAMIAIEQGTAGALVSALIRDEARAGRIIQKIKDGPEVLFSSPEVPTGRMQKQPQLDPMTGEPVVDPMTGEPVMVETQELEMAPTWMPRYSDNLPVFRHIFEDWMKTEDYERLEPEMQKAAADIYRGVLLLEAEKNAEAAAAQAAQAEQMGMTNAAKDQPDSKPNPSLPSVSNQESEPAAA